MPRADEVQVVRVIGEESPVATIPLIIDVELKGTVACGFRTSKSVGDYVLTSFHVTAPAEELQQVEVKIQKKDPARVNIVKEGHIYISTLDGGSKLLTIAEAKQIIEEWEEGKWAMKRAGSYVVPMPHLIALVFSSALIPLSLYDFISFITAGSSIMHPAISLAMLSWGLGWGWTVVLSLRRLGVK